MKIKNMTDDQRKTGKSMVWRGERKRKRRDEERREEEAKRGWQKAEN